MHFDDTPEQAAWREECRAWIADALERIDSHGDPIAQAKAWQAAKFDA